jgi:hypothetical protein
MLSLVSWPIMGSEFEWWCNVKHECSGTNDAAPATASAGREKRARYATSFGSSASRNAMSEPQILEICQGSAVCSLLIACRRL